MGDLDVKTMVVISVGVLTALYLYLTARKDSKEPVWTDSSVVMDNDSEDCLDEDVTPEEILESFQSSSDSTKAVNVDSLSHAASSTELDFPVLDIAEVPGQDEDYETATYTGVSSHSFDVEFPDTDLGKTADTEFEEHDQFTQLPPVIVKPRGSNQNDEDFTTDDDVLSEDSVNSNASSHHGHVRRRLHKKDSTLTDVLEVPPSQYDYLLKELIATEKTYIENMSLLLHIYMEPMKNYLSDKEMSSIFTGSTISTLRSLHKDHFLWILERTNEPGLAFERVVPFLKMYGSYINNFNHSISALDGLLKSNKGLRQFMNSRLEKNTPGIESLLICPIQRIPRYLLLIRQLIPELNETDIERSRLESALVKLEDITGELNHQKGILENCERLMELKDSFKSIFVSNIYPDRQLIKEATVRMAYNTTSKRGTYMMILFSDMVIISTMKLKPKKRFYFSENFEYKSDDVIVTQKRSGRTKTLYAITLSQTKGNSTTSRSIFYNYSSERDNWIDAFNGATKAFFNRENSS